MVKVRDRVRLVTNQVVEAVRRVRVDKAVSDPLTCPDRLIDIGHHLECRLDTILVGFALVQPIDVVFSGEPENVETVLTGESDQLSGLRPVDLINSS